MKPFWHPLSTILVAEPPCLATPELLRLLLRGGSVPLIYAGDRMWPTLEHGTRLEVTPLAPGFIPRGTVVLTGGSTIPDLLRVEHDDGDRVTLVGDADPGPPIELPRGELMARADLPLAPASPARRRHRRLRIDLREARCGPDPTDGDPAHTVLEKYDYQAPFYSRVPGPDMDPALLEAFSRRVPRPSRVLVVGSGAGRECFALAGKGWAVHGIDFSREMVAQARTRAAERDIDASFTVGDLRSHHEPAASLHGVLFTYDVYSFIPRVDRVAALERVRSWLDPEGAVFLSARRVQTLYEKTVLGITRWSRRSGDVALGDSHTRWIDGKGALRRSFVHLFTDHGLQLEIHRAGFVQRERVAGHTVLRPLAPLQPAILLAPSPQPG